MCAPSSPSHHDMTIGARKFLVPSHHPRAKDEADAVKIANDTPYGLAATSPRHRRKRPQGRPQIRAATSTSMAFPTTHRAFGGYKQSATPRVGQIRMEGISK